MNEMTIGHLFAIGACALVASALLIIGVVLLIDKLERAKYWLKKRKMKTYMVQYITNRSYRDRRISFVEDMIETKYFKARNPQMAVKKLLDEDYFKVSIRDICICKVEEIQPK